MSVWIVGFIAFVAAIAAASWFWAKKLSRDWSAEWKEKVEVAKAASGWVPDKAIYVNGDCYMAAGYRIEDSALDLYRSYVHHFANYGLGSPYSLGPIRTETVVKVFAPGKWDGVSFEEEE